MKRAGCVVVGAAALAASSALAASYTIEEVGKLTCSEAIDHLKKGREEGNAQAIYLTAQFVIRGFCFKRDLAVHARLLRQAADAGRTDAMRDLGYAYALGEGVEQDYASAGAWVHKAGGDPGRKFDEYTLGYAYATSRWVGARVVSFFPNWVTRSHKVLATVTVLPRERRVEHALRAQGSDADDDELRKLIATLDINLRDAIKDVHKTLATPRAELLGEVPFKSTVLVTAHGVFEPEPTAAEPLDQISPR